MSQNKPTGHLKNKAPREVCTAWLEKYGKPTKRINRRVGCSYRLKGYVERWYKAVEGRHRHIPAEAFTAAAIGLGYALAPDGELDGDCFFNLAKPRVDYE